MKGSIGLEFVSMTFWKRQNYKGREDTSGFQELRERKMSWWDTE